MSVLYPIVQTTYFRESKKTNPNSLLRFLLLFIIAGFSFTFSFGQEPEKEAQIRKEAEMKKQEAAQMEAKMKANPQLMKRNQPKDQQAAPDAVVSMEEQKRKINEAGLAEKIREQAKKQEEAKAGPSLPGIEYKVYTNTQGQVSYRVTNAGKEIFSQQVNAPSGSLYDSKTQAEKEAIYASNLLRRNSNYPLNALQAEIKSLVTSQNANPAGNSANRNQRTNADITFNGGGGTIPSSGNASPYPSTINVSGLPAGSTVKSVTLTGLNHTWCDDVDIVLRSPGGASVILMSDVGGSADLINHNYTFDDAAALSLADNAVLASGTYKPTNFVTGDNWPAPGPGTTPTSTTLSTFGTVNHNGAWSLFIVDDLGGDVGNWSSWSITFSEPVAACFPITITSQPANASACPVPSPGATAAFSVTATPAGVTYNWQENQGSGFVYLANGGQYSGVNAATLNISGITAAMNGYQYRCVIICPSGGLPEISNFGTLSVSPSAPAAPSISPTSASICPGGSVALNITSSQGAATVTASSGPIAVPVSDLLPPATSDITVAGFPAVAVASVSVNFNMTHTWDGDVRVNLVAPNGNILNLVNLRGGSGDNFTNTTISSGSGTSLTTGTAPFTGTFAADAANAVGFAPYLSNVTAFSSLFSTPNGTWTLVVTDHFGGDDGTITSWSITINGVAVPDPAVWTPATGLFNDAALSSAYVAGTFQSTVYAAPATTTTYSASVTNGTCLSAASSVTVTVNTAATITLQPGNGVACAGGTKTFSVAATGTGVTYQWQVDAGSGFSNITASANNPSGFIYTGFNSTTLSINDVLPTLNGFIYRCVVTGTCPPALNSNTVTLAVNSLPTISIAKNNQCAPTVLTASGADTYSWTPTAGLSPTTGAVVTASPTSNSTYTVTGTVTASGCQNTATVDVKFTPPVPVVSPASATICLGTVQPLSITSSSLPPVAATASSGPINLIIPDADFDGMSHTLNIAGVTGAVQSISVNFNITHTWDSDIDINLVAPNGNVLNLVGARGGSGDNFTNTTISSASTTSLGTGAAPFSGTFAADGFIGFGPDPYLSNVSTFASLLSIPNGVWRIAIADFAGGDEGTLLNWSITINYAVPDAGVWTPNGAGSGLFTDALGTIVYTGTPASTVYASPAATTTYSVTVTSTSTETRTFTSGTTVTVPGVAPGSTVAGAGAPYPATLNVAGIPAGATVKSVKIKGAKHSFPDDIDIVLRSPTGVDVVLMSDVGGSIDVTGQIYTFDDAAAGTMADAALNATGTYRPTNIGATDVFPAPVGSITQATPTLSLFTGDPNGSWSLFVADDLGADVGSISSWEITFTMPNPVSCTSAPRTVTVTVNIPIVFTTQPQNRTICQNDNVTFTVAATGTIQTYQWQVSTNGGTTWTNIAGATTATLSLTNMQPVISPVPNRQYRCLLTNVGCGSSPSAVATLIVNPLPTVSLAVAGQTQLRPGMLATLSVSSNPAGASYQWFVNGVLQPGISGSSYVVDAYHLGTYTVRVTSVNNCVSTTNGITFTALVSDNLFIYPNPTSGAYFVTYYMPQVGSPVSINVIDMKGRKLVGRQAVTSAPYTRFDFDASNLAAGVYVIEFRDSSGDRLAVGRLVVNR